MGIGKNRQAIAELRNAHPDWTQYKLRDELVKITGETITVQRVGQILRRENLAARAIKYRPEVACALCGEATDGAKLHVECREEFYYDQVYCTICNKPKTLLKSIIERMLRKGQQNFYCTRAHFLVAKGLGYS